MPAEFYLGKGKTVPWTEIPGRNPMELAYADVELVPQMTSIESRREVNLSTTLGPYSLRLPIISAPMDTISGEAMIRELAHHGAIGTLPRQEGAKFAENLHLCNVFTQESIPCIYTVGVKEGASQAAQLYANGARVILIDVANGGMNNVIELAKDMKTKWPDITVIAGNIATYDQAKAYQDAGVIDIARVGIGPGGACTTRIMAGVGVPQLSAVMDTAATGMSIIADGGIMEPGDVGKAIAAGADFVMVGSMFAGTDETPGKVVDGRKSFRGQASRDYMHDHGVSGEKTPEGISTTVPYKGPVAEVIKSLEGGIRSAMSYSNAYTLTQLQERGKFVVISPAARYESIPHAADTGH